MLLLGFETYQSFGLYNILPIEICTEAKKTQKYGTRLVAYYCT